ncbi:MAG TPA: molybdate ABC transporter substrate-binding protein [Rhizomicrobium sp.]|nr:molybdate ABC transporter substrate-binding protein [Rhizomicrobium sp.]
MMKYSQFGRRALLAGLVLLLLPLQVRSEPQTVTVFAASSLTNSLQSIAALYKAKTGATIALSFGASSTIARQIDQGAAADIFISADEDWMDFLQKNGRLADGTRSDLLGNRLVLIAPTDSKATIKIEPHFDLLGALQGGRLAVADPSSVPAGKYARAALTSLGVWDGISAHLAQAENVRVALEYVARGETPFGIVYATDAQEEKGVSVVATFPDNSHAPIVYPAALMKSAMPEAKAFLTFLEGPQGRAVFEKDGFTFLGR